MQCDLGLLATVANNCSFGSSSSRNIVLQATECWNTISRSAGGSRRTPTCAFRRWQSVICNRTYCVEASPRQQAESSSATL